MVAYTELQDKLQLVIMALQTQIAVQQQLLWIWYKTL